MVINSASKLISFLDQFNPTEESHYKTLHKIVKIYPLSKLGIKFASELKGFTKKDIFFRLSPIFILWS